MKWIASLAIAAVAVGLLGSCAHRACVQPEVSCQLRYWQVVSTDVEGCWISEYIAEGDVTPACDGFDFRAVQRRTFRPVTLTYRYPLGRPVSAKAPNIIITPTRKPLWLKIMDRSTPPPDQCASSRLCFYRK
ncbi:MAG: hypothetical protein NTZ46_05935 [Verrucomicrobia bacterium]|nr:hypothetical protein [Verrucomicrobiota bacterium]